MTNPFRFLAATMLLAVTAAHAQAQSPAPPVAPGPTPSQTSAPDGAAITAVIQRLFTAMAKGDSAMARSAFASPVTTATIARDKNGKPVLRRESDVAAFVKAIGSPRKEVWNEEVWNIIVQQDGDFAQVWCDYAFYLDDTFHHCGIDAFQLHKGADGWKIFHLADTRRTDNCAIPDNIQRKHKPSR